MPCTITGNKPSGLVVPVVSIGLNDAWLIIETSDGKVCKVRPSAVAAVINTAFRFVTVAFTGNTISIPVAQNGGKVPAEDEKIDVYTNGIMDYPVLDYSITRNGVGIPDDIVFVNPRANDDILVKFTL